MRHNFKKLRAIRSGGIAAVVLAALCSVSTLFAGEVVVEEAADDINGHVLVANPEGVWRYDVTSSGWIARGKFAQAPNAWSVAQAGKRIYVATQESFGGRILTFDVCGNALGEFATLDYQPTKLAVSADGKRLFVSGLGANGGVWRYELDNSAPPFRIFTGQARGVVLTKHGTVYIAKAAASDGLTLADVGRSVNANSASIHDAETGASLIDSNFASGIESSIFYDADVNKVYLQIDNKYVSRITLDENGKGSINNAALRENAGVTPGNYNYERTIGFYVKFVKVKARLWFYKTDGSGLAFDDCALNAAPATLNAPVEGTCVRAYDIAAVDLRVHPERYRDYVLVSSSDTGVRKYEVSADGTWTDCGGFCLDRAGAYNAGGIARHGDDVYVAIWDGSVSRAAIWNYSIKGRNKGKVFELENQRPNGREFPWQLGVSADGTALYAVTRDGSVGGVYRIDLAGDGKSWTQIAENGSRSAGFTANDLVYVANYVADSGWTRPAEEKNNYLTVYNAKTGELAQNYTGTSVSAMIALDPADNLFCKTIYPNNTHYFTAQPLAADGLLADSLGKAATDLRWATVYVGAVQGRIVRIGKAYFVYPGKNQNDQAANRVEGPLYRIHQWADHGMVRMTEGNMPRANAIVVFRTYEENGFAVIVR